MFVSEFDVQVSGIAKKSSFIVRQRLNEIVTMKHRRGRRCEWA